MQHRPNEPERSIGDHGKPFIGWQCPKYMFDGIIYPEFLSGAGYILPIEVLPCLYQEGRFVHQKRKTYYRAAMSQPRRWTSDFLQGSPKRRKYFLALYWFVFHAWIIFWTNIFLQWVLMTYCSKESHHKRNSLISSIQYHHRQTVLQSHCSRESDSHTPPLLRRFPRTQQMKKCC